MTDARSLTLSFPPPNPPATENYIRGLHWAKARRRLGPWKTAAQYAWTALSVAERELVSGQPCVVQVELPFRTSQHRDPHNYVGTVCKAIVDGLKSDYVAPFRGAKKVETFRGAWPDDTPEWVTVLEPICERRDGDVIVRITIREPAAREESS